MKRVASRRPSFNSKGRINSPMTSNIKKKLINDQQSDLTTIQSGGL